MTTVAPPDVFGCRLASGRFDRDGYVWAGSARAHKAAWIAAHGQIPDGMEVDHLCRRRNCIALHHLELVTRSENELRKGWGKRARRATCPKGHDMNTNAIVTPEAGRVCRTCNRESMANSMPHPRV